MVHLAVGLALPYLPDHIYLRLHRYQLRRIRLRNGFRRVSRPTGLLSRRWRTSATCYGCPPQTGQKQPLYITPLFIGYYFRSDPPPIPQAAGIVGEIPRGENTLLVCGNRFAKVSSLNNPTSIISFFINLGYQDVLRDECGYRSNDMGGASFGILPFENFAPRSPWRCLRAFSSSLRSRVIIIVFFIDFQDQDPHRFIPPPTEAWMQFTYWLIGRSTIFPLAIP